MTQTHVILPVKIDGSTDDGEMSVNSLPNASVARSFRKRFKAAAQIFREKLLRFGVEVRFVFGSPSAMTLVFIENVFHRLVGLTHSGHHLLALGRFDSHIVG